MTIGDLIINIGFEIDDDATAQVQEKITEIQNQVSENTQTNVEASANAAEEEKKNIKSVEKSQDENGNVGQSAWEKIKSSGVLACTAILASLKEINAILESWYSVDVVIDQLNTDLESTAEVHDYINDAANELRISYSTIAENVGDLVRTGNALFETTEEATDFLVLADKQFKASGASESEIASLNNALVESFRTGRVSAGAFNSIMQTSPETISLLAESLNMSEQQVKALGTQGKLTAAQLYSAFEESSENIEASFSNVRVTISEALGEFKNTIGTFLTNLNDATGITDEIAKELERVLGFLQPIFDMTISWCSYIFGFVNELFDILEPVWDVVQGFFDMIMDAVNQILAAFQKIITSVVEPIMNLISRVVDVVMSFVNKIMPVVQKILDFVVGIIDMLADLLANVLGNILDIVMSVLEPILDMLGSLMDMLDPLLDVIMEIMDAVMGLVGSIMGLVNGVLGTVFDAIQPIVELITQVVDLIMNILQPVLEAIIDVISAILSVLTPILNVLQPIFDIITQLLNSGIMAALEPILKIVEVISGLFSALMGDTTALKDAFKDIGEWFSNIWQKVKDFFQKIKDAMNNIKEFFQNIFKAIGNFFIKIINGLISGFEGFVNFFVKAINGLTQGLSKLWTWMGIPAIPEINEVSFNRLSYLAQGGYIGRDNPSLAVIGDNMNEGEIVAPESKLRENIMQALDIYMNASAPQFKLAAMQSMGGNTYDNRVFNTNTQVYNTYDGSKDAEKIGSKVTTDITNEVVDNINKVLASMR